MGAVARKLICNLVESLPEESKAKARLSSKMQTKEKLGCARGGLWHPIHAHGPADAGVSKFPMDTSSQSRDSPTRSHLVPSRPSVLVLTLFTLHPQPLRLLPLRIWNLFPQHLLPVSFLPEKHCLDFSDQSCRRPPPPMTRLLLPLPYQAFSPAPESGKAEWSCYCSLVGRSEPEVLHSSMLMPHCSSAFFTHPSSTSYQ